MTSPRFRSTAAFAQQSRREVSLVDWATFVVFTLGGRYWAVPVECTERVVRTSVHDGPSPTSIKHGEQLVPVFDLARAILTDLPPLPIALGAPSSSATDRGWLLLSVHEGWVACLVDAVREVATIDAATVRAVPHNDPRQARGDSVRGVFTRRDHEVLVLDLSRVVRAAHDASRHSDV